MGFPLLFRMQVDEQAYMEDTHEHDQEHTQEAVSAGSEDDHQDE
jgi:hypothetical protein